MVIICQSESFMLLQKTASLQFCLCWRKTTDIELQQSEYEFVAFMVTKQQMADFFVKALGPYTQLYLTHINQDGTDSPAVYLDNFSSPNTPTISLNL